MNRSRALTIAGWGIAVAVLLPRAAGLERLLDVGVRVAGSESAATQSQLAQQFGSPYASFVVLVVTGAPSPTTPAGLALLDSLTRVIRLIPGVTGVQGYTGPRDTLLLGRDGQNSLMFVGLDDIHASPDAVIPRLRAATAAFPGATLRWTGQAALNTDLRRVSADDIRTAERRVLPLTLLLLVVAFGTVVAAGLPVLAGALTIGLASGAAALLASRWPLSIMLQNVVSMIGLGLGIDYALLAVSRFREALAAGRSADEAARETVRQAGHTIALSGFAVAVGFAGLLAIPVNELRSVGVGGLLTVALAMLVAVTLLPILLAWLGGRVNRGAVPLVWRPHARGAGWHRWGRWVARHPLPVLLVAGAPLVALAWPAHRLHVGEPGGDWLPPGMESAQALHDLERMGRSGILQTIRVVMTLPEGNDVRSSRGWTAARRVQEWLEHDERTAFVRSVVKPDGSRWAARLLFLTLPDSEVRTLISRDRRAVLFDLVPKEGSDPNALLARVHDARRLDVAQLTGLPGARLTVGGLPGFRADYLDAVGSALPFVIVVIVIGTTLALAWGFRSVLIPLKAVLLNLCSVSAGFGALVLVFQDRQGMDQIFVAIPALVFCAVFGLSMDYEVFLVARVAEARRAGATEIEAIAEALARTGPVITNAAAVMVVVFGAFALGKFLMIRMLGLALAVTVLVDATLVRIAIGPALLALAGRWNWWPGERRSAAAPGAALEVPIGTAE